MHFIILLFFYIAPSSATDRICKIINYACDSNSFNSPGDTYPAAADTYNNNPSSIPTEKTPIGIEILVSSEDKASFGLFKGYGQFGLAGGSVSKKNSFFSNSPNANALGIIYPKVSGVKMDNWGPDINKDSYYSGFAFSLFPNALKDILVPAIGVAARYYTESKYIKESLGLSLNREQIHLGISYSKTDDSTIVENRNIGVKLQRVSIDVTRLMNIQSSYNSNKTWIYSSIYRGSQWVLLFSIRKQERPNLTQNQKNVLQANNIQIPAYHYFVGAQYDLSKVISLGVYVNYVLEKTPYLGVRFTLGNI